MCNIILSKKKKYHSSKILILKKKSKKTFFIVQYIYKANFGSFFTKYNIYLFIKCKCSNKSFKSSIHHIESSECKIKLNNKI